MPITPDQALLVGLMKQLRNVPPEVSSVAFPPSRNVEDIDFRSIEKQMIRKIVRTPNSRTPATVRSRKNVVQSILGGVEADQSLVTGQIDQIRDAIGSQAEVFDPSNIDALDELQELTVDRNEAIRAQHVLSQESARRKNLLRRISKVLKTGKFAPLVLIAGLMLGSLGGFLGREQQEQVA